MNLIRWEPFKETDDFFRTLSPALFNRFSRQFSDRDQSEYQWSPMADISETDKEYLVKAELPGVKREDVKVTLEDGILCIEGERKFEKSDKSEKSHRVERFYGKFRRGFGLPEHVDANGIRAESKDGVLQVHVPKSAIQKPSSIQIKVD